MGSLTINDPPSMEEQILTPLNSLETSFNALLTSLTTTPSYSAAPSAAQSLLTADHSLTTTLQALYVHQNNYAQILHLREEASRLEDQIKTTIRTCVDLRKDIGNIHPSILSYHSEDADSDDDIDGDRKQQDIDYNTLLSFASKIGKHNNAAAKEAEEESVRRLVTARQEKKTAIAAEPSINGNGTASTAAASSTATAGITNGESTSQSLLPQHEKDWLDGEAAMARARAGMAFPVAENLRRGALGRLQWIREQQQQQGGEEAVDREVERMIAEAEGRRPRDESPPESTESAQHHTVVETAARRQGAGLP